MMPGTETATDTPMVDDRRADVIVIGAGVIGLGIAWRAAARGLDVCVVDPSPGSGSTWAAAGMLAPTTELHYGETPLLALTRESARRYPEFVADLEAAAGMTVAYRRCGTVHVAWDPADLAGLRDLHTFGQTLGVRAHMVTGRELRRLEPALAAGLPGALFAPDDHQVDNRRLHTALVRAAEWAGVRMVSARVRTLTGTSERIRGVRLEDDTDLVADTVVLAGGSRSASIEGIPESARPPVRPVKGQTLRLRVRGALPISHVVRGSVRGTPVYLVPRADGEIVIGASSEEAGFDLSPRAGAVYELLRDATALVPELAEAELAEVATGLRPGSPDNAPVLGWTAVPGLAVATGHHRNGILLTPVTADGMAALLAGDPLPTELAPFGPGRFTEGKVA